MKNQNIKEWVTYFLEVRRNLGFQLKGTDKLLYDFAEFAEKYGNKIITHDLSLKWARLPEKAALRYWARRLEIVRCFARFVSVFVPETEIPPKGILGPAHPREMPHIFSVKEIDMLMKSCENLFPINGLRTKTYQTLFGILYSTGLRISEALKLELSDVNFDVGTLLVKETKFHKSRILPLHSTTIKALKEYSDAREKICKRICCYNFFISDKGTAMHYETVRGTFRKMCISLNLKNNNKNRKHPRLYDFRHTFACNVLAHWQRSGANITQLLPALSTYLGHVHICDTYWYLTGVPQLFETTGQIFENYVKSTQKKEVYHEND